MDMNKSKLSGVVGLMKEILSDDKFKTDAALEVEIAKEKEKAVKVDPRIKFFKTATAIKTKCTLCSNDEVLCTSNNKFSTWLCDRCLAFKYISIKNKHIINEIERSFSAIGQIMLHIDPENYVTKVYASRNLLPKNSLDYLNSVIVAKNISEETLKTSSFVVGKIMDETLIYTSFEQENLLIIQTYSVDRKIHEYYFELKDGVYGLKDTIVSEDASLM